MGLRFYNTLSRKIEEFRPQRPGRITMFVCGPTVYDLSHIGHGKTYSIYDMIVRFLKFLGYDVFYVMNITDIDDKILNRAKETGEHPLELARKYTREFMLDMKLLGISSVNLYALATAHVPEIIQQIDALLDKGIAYRVNGDIYYDISQFAEYGKLSGQRPEELRVHRIDPNPRKRNPGDFVLWKSQKPSEVAWDSPWGKGRPGWHIEDTAITLTYLGPGYDIHGGGTELIFPHHEAEIAQAEAMTGKKPLARIWLHSGLLHIKGQEMHKSLGNFIPIREALRRYSSETFRLFYASNHYRSPLDYTEEKLQQAQTLLKKIYSAFYRLNRMHSYSQQEPSQHDTVVSEALEIRKRFIDSLEDDFNTPQALSELLALVDLSERSRDPATMSMLSDTLRELGTILGLFEREMFDNTLAGIVELVLELREDARKSGKFSVSDKIRERLLKLGIIVEDTTSGSVWAPDPTT